MYKKIVRDRYVADRVNNYPFILVHGFLGYGEGSALNSLLPYFGFRPDRNVVKQARSLGYEVYAPSLGGFNSMWDRACDLYAQIVGGTTDYGKVHSEKFGHLRYGHTYDKPRRCRGLFLVYSTPNFSLMKAKACLSAVCASGAQV